MIIHSADQAKASASTETHRLHGMPTDSGASVTDVSPRLAPARLLP